MSRSSLIGSKPACCRHRSSTRCSSMAAVTALSARRSSRPIASAFFQRRWRSPEPRRGIVARRTPAGERRRRRHSRSPTRRPWRLQCGRHRRIQPRRPAVDVLVRADGTIDHLESPWIDTVHVRGSGARSQPRRLRPLLAARMRSTRSVRRSVRHGSAAGLAVGRSRWGRPVAHWISG